MPYGFSNRRKQTARKSTRGQWYTPLAAKEDSCTASHCSSPVMNTEKETSQSEDSATSDVNSKKQRLGEAAPGQEGAGASVQPAVADEVQGLPTPES